MVQSSLSHIAITQTRFLCELQCTAVAHGYSICLLIHFHCWLIHTLLAQSKLSCVAHCMHATLLASSHVSRAFRSEVDGASPSAIAVPIVVGCTPSHIANVHCLLPEQSWVYMLRKTTKKERPLRDRSQLSDRAAPATIPPYVLHAPLPALCQLLHSSYILAMVQCYSTQSH